MAGKIVGAPELVKRIQRVRVQAVGILSDNQAADLLLRRMQGRFIEGVSPRGEAWPNLMEETVARKRRKGYPFPDRPLYGTGSLYRSLAVIRGVNTGLLASNTGIGFRIGVSDPRMTERGRIHNYGLGGQEERRFIGLSPLDVVAVSGMLRRRLKSIAK